MPCLRTQLVEDRPYDSTCAPGRFEPTLVVDTGADQLQVESARVATGQCLRDERLDRDGPVAGHRPTWQRSVAEHVVAELDQPGARQRTRHEFVDVAFGPAVEHVNA